jgi:hypothetical protein
VRREWIQKSRVEEEEIHKNIWVKEASQIEKQRKKQMGDKLVRSGMKRKEAMPKSCAGEIFVPEISVEEERRTPYKGSF